MESELTEQILKLQAGDHLCLFYDRDPSEQMPALIPFIHDGLANGEQVIYVADDQTVDALVGRLEQSGIHVGKESDRGALKLWTRREWRQAGDLSSARKFLQVSEFIDGASRAGFTGVRFAIEMTWTLGPDISAERLEHWEATLNRIFVPQFPGRIVCQYNRSRLNPDAMLAALHTHPLLILGDHVYPNFFYQAPLILNANGNAAAGKSAKAARVDWMIEQLRLARATANEHERWIRQSSAEASHRLAAIVESSDDAIVSKDLDGVIRSWNRGAEQLFGYTASEAIGKPVSILIPAERHDEEPGILERIRRGERIEHYETVRQRKDGSLVEISLTVSPIKDSEGKIIGASKIARDITDRRRTEEQLRKARNDLARANEELAKRVTERTLDLSQAKAALLRDIEEQNRLQEQLRQAQKMESIGTLAGGIAHDFNNILNIIKGYVAALGENFPGDENVAASLKVIDDAIERGTATVRQLLTLARKTEANLVSTNANQIISELAKLLKHTFPKTINVALELDRRLPSMMADPSQISQVLLNLCVNARDAMPSGGNLTVRTTLVHRRTVAEHHAEAVAPWYVCIEVVDTGVGMDAGVRSRIFEPFFTTKETGQGTGLGLSIVYAIVKNHHALIDVESQPGRGTTFRLYLPIASVKEKSSAEPVPLEAPVQREEPAVKAGNDRGTILLAEDEENMVQLLKRVLGQRGYQVLVAADGAVAIDLFSRHSHEIDVVLLDLGLPKIAGWDLIRRLKDKNPAVNVVVASGYIEPELKSKMFEAGVKAVVHKPYAVTTIIETLQEVIEKSRIPMLDNAADSRLNA
jgi:two-component system cell cycle sensor histidine kinase/response regulator CckA